MAEIPAQRESTSTDYWNVLNPFGIQSSTPSTRYNFHEDAKGHLNMEDPKFKAIYDKADLQTKREMLDGRSNNDSIKIAERRKVYDDSSKAIEQDGIATQLAMGIIPTLVTPSTLIAGGPIGAMYKTANLIQTAGRVTTALKFGALGAVTGATMNTIDEAFMAQQGIQHDYISAGGAGMIFGGGLGGLVGGIVGPARTTIAKALSPQDDEYAKHFNQDPDVQIHIGADSIPKMQPGQMEKSLFDRIPIIGKYLRSDMHFVAQSEDSVLREFNSRIAPLSVSQKDMVGNIMPTTKTGMDDKRQLKGIQNVLTKEVDEAFFRAVESGGVSNRQDFDSSTWDSYMEAVNRQNTHAHEYAKMMTRDMPTENLTPAEVKGLRKVYQESYNEWLLNNSVDFKGMPHAIEGAKAYQKYYSKMLKEGKLRGVKELQGISEHRLYAPRVYNYKAIHSGKVTSEQVKDQLRNALASAPENSFKTAKELEEAVDVTHTMLMNSSFDLNNLSNSFMVKDLPFATHLKSKKIYLNETKMKDLLVNDFHDVTGMYHYKMSGRYATQFAFGTDSLEEIMGAIRTNSLAKGIVNNTEEIQAFERNVQDLLGTLRMNSLSNTPAWTFTRNVMSYNSARLMGGAGGNQLIELSTAAIFSGISNIFKGGMGRALRDSGKLLYTKGKVDDDFSNFILASGYMEEALHTSRINRFADTESGFNSGTIEKGLHWLSDKQMKYNGMRYILATMENYVGGAVVSTIKSGKYNVETLARWGLSEADALAIKQDLDLHYNPKEGKFDLASFTQDNRDKLQLAISRGIDESVIQGDSIHLPAWMKTPGPFKSLITQFLRFPLIAQETLLRSGMKERQSEMVVAVMASTVAYLGLKHLREQASIALGFTNEYDAKYDYTNSDNLKRALAESLNYNAPLGFTTSVFNYGAIALGKNELGREWQDKQGMPGLLGPSYGLGEDVIQVIRDISDGSIDNERTYQRAKSFMPWLSLPVLSDGAKEIAKNID